MLPGHHSPKTRSARSKSPDTREASDLDAATRTSAEAPWVQLAAAQPRAARPATLLHLQQQVGNRTINRLLAATRPPVMSVSRSGSAPTIQRTLTAEDFKEKILKLGFRNIKEPLATDLLALINLVIGKYPDYEDNIIENLDSILLNVNERFPIQYQIYPLLNAIAQVLINNGLKKFEVPEGVDKLGKKVEEKKEEVKVPDEELEPDELAARQGALQELGKETEGMVDLNKRPTVKLTMGQGLVVNLGQYILVSDEFSTCSPIVIFNAKTHMGGLFHFPAKSLKKQKQNLTNMYKRAKPTDIYLNPRTDIDLSIDNVKKLDSSDADALKKFFIKELSFDGKLHTISLQSNQYAVTLNTKKDDVLIQNEIKSEGPKESVFHDQTGKGRKKVAEKFAEWPSITKFGRDDWHD